MGPALTSDAVLRRLFAAGVSAARINFAHGKPPEHARWVRRIRSAARAVGRPVAILADLGGPKIRVRGLRGGRMQLSPGAEVFLVLERDEREKSIPVSEPRLIRDIRPGDPIFLADGSFELKALSKRGTAIRCRVVTGGLLLEGKGVNVPRTSLKLGALTRKDRRDLANALSWNVDAVALSFVRRPQDVALTIRLMGKRRVPLFAKIEKAEAIRHLEAIIAASDGVMVARGDLGVETSLVEIPILQKRIIGLANATGKPVITATQMLRSMVESPHPTRAEATDVANAILDGTDAVMLSEETAMGNHPVKAVETMAAIARHAEAHLPTLTHEQRYRASGIPASALAVSDSAVDLADAVKAVAIVTPTRSGATARNVARLRPRVPVLALSRNRGTVAALQFSWGIRAAYVPQKQQLEAIIDEAARQLRRQGIARSGDAYILTAGYPSGRGDSNLLTVQYVPGRSPRDG